MATFYNQAQLIYEGRTINSNTVSAELVEAITADKTATRSTYENGDRLTYVINLRNTSSSDIIGLTINDDLGTNTVDGVTTTPLTYVNDSVLYYTNGQLNPDPTVSTTPSSLSISGITVPAGGDAIIVYEADTNGATPYDIGSTIDNNVTITGADLAEPVGASETVAADVAPQLSITKAVSPDIVTENGTVTYTFSIENRGNVPAAGNVVVSDTFSPVLNNITVTIDNRLATEPDDYTYDATTGLFRTTENSITVPAATYERNPDTGDITVIPGVTTVRVTGTI